MNDLKVNIKALAKEKDITIAQLARSTGIAPQTLNNWLAGQEPRSLNQVKKVADYFNISIDQLCFGIKKPRSAIEDFNEEINAGVFEVVLRRVKR